MSPQEHTREDFIKEYVFPDIPTRDFELDGHSAEYASGHPHDWGREAGTLDFGVDVQDDDEGTFMRYYHSALSPDRRLLAISCCVDRILIYDIASKELRQVLEGAGSVVWRPLVSKVTGTNADRRHGVPAYTLVSSISDEAFRGGPIVNQLILWDLDRSGRLLDEEEPIDPALFATKAIDAIFSDLATLHEWTRDFVDASTLHAEFTKVLGRVAADHRRRHNAILNDAMLSGYGSPCFSSDGKLLLYHSQNRTAQLSMRDPDNLPRVVVYDVDAGKEVHRLSGHTDAIKWSDISPDSQYIASVSWDGTLRMYFAATGELAWATEDSGGQCWAGSFSADSKFIVWSSAYGRLVQVHTVVDGRIVSTFQEAMQQRCLCLEWHPARYEVALCVGKHAYVWNVFDGADETGTIAQHFAMDDLENWFWHDWIHINRVRWLDGGRCLHLKLAGTHLVYDVQSNTKELFRRPNNEGGAWVGLGFYDVLHEHGEQDFYLSVDGDGKVRYWPTGVVASRSWGEKETAAVSSTEEETEKDVKITKTSVKNAPQQESGGDAWAEKGAGASDCRVRASRPGICKIDVLGTKP